VQNGAGVGGRSDGQDRPGKIVARVIGVELGAGQAQDGQRCGVGGRADGCRVGVEVMAAGRGQVELAVIDIKAAEVGGGAGEREGVRAEFLQADVGEGAGEVEVFVDRVEAERGVRCREDRVVGDCRELRVAPAVGREARGGPGDEGSAAGNAEAGAGLRAE